MSDKIKEVSLVSDSFDIKYDGNDTELELVVLKFKGGKQLTFMGEEAKRYVRHYLNGLSVSEMTEIPLPKPLEVLGNTSSLLN